MSDDAAAAYNACGDRMGQTRVTQIDVALQHGMQAVPTA
jgi:hypothetical protein